MKSWIDLPDPAICRTEHVYNELYDCLVESKDVCRCLYALEFGSRYFCRHPERSKFEKIDTGV